MGGLTLLGVALGLLEERRTTSAAAPTTTRVSGAEDVAVAGTAEAATTVAPSSEPTLTVAQPVLVVGASIPPLADLVARVGGDRVKVVSVVPQGVDGHTYEPTPSDAIALTGVDIQFFASKLLNPAVTRLAESNLSSDAIVVDLLEATVFEDDVIADRTHSHGGQGTHSHVNVHVWTDPTIAMRWVDEIERTLVGADLEGIAWYQANAARLRNQLQQLHEATIEATSSVPAEFRKLVVYHDSWSYFGRTYGYEVMGALQAADFAEPSASEMGRMIKQVREAGVPAFFGAAVFPTEVLERVSEEAGVPYVPDLADDELPGEPGSPRHSYVGMMVDNVRHIVGSLGGDPTALDGVTL